MASTAYLKAAQEKRQPVVFVRVDTAGGVRKSYTTQADWAGSATLTDVDTDEVVGSAIHGTTAEVATAYEGPDIRGFDDQGIINVPFNGWLTRIRARVYWNGDNPSDWKARIGIKVGSAFTYYGTFPSGYRTSDASYISQWAEFTALGKISGSWYADVTFEFGPIVTETQFTAAVDLYVAGFDNDFSDGYYRQVYLNTSDTTAVTMSGYFCDAAATLTTSTIDMGLILASPPTLYIDDTRPSGSSLSYTAVGGNSDPPATSLGTVTSGAALGATGYRYYRITPTFATTNGARALVDELRIVGGPDATFVAGTHKNEPFRGVAPLLPKDPLGTLSSAISLDKPTSVGEASLRLLWTDTVSNLIATGELRNKTVTIKHGFVGLSEDEYETVFIGTWANYRGDQKSGIITVQIQDALRRFMEVKLPRETVSTGGTKTTTPLTFTSENAMDVILSLLDEMGIPEEYIDRTGIEALRDGVFAGPEYDVTRNITKPVEVWKLIYELASVCGCFVVGDNGKITIVPYNDDPTAGTVNIKYAEFGDIDGGQGDLYTAQVVYYDPNVDPPGDTEEDYDKAYVLINATSETAYGEIKEQRWFEKWGFVPSIITAFANRRDTWFANPRLRVTASKIPLTHVAILPGDVVAVKGLQVPCTTANKDAESEFSAIILKRTFDVRKCALTFDLLQLSEAYPGFTTGFSLGFRS